MLHAERYSAESLLELLLNCSEGNSLPIYHSPDPEQPPVVVGWVYRAPRAWYVAGGSFHFAGQPLGYVVEQLGMVTYNRGEKYANRISCWPQAEQAAVRLSTLILTSNAKAA